MRRFCFLYGTKIGKNFTDSSCQRSLISRKTSSN